MLRQQNLKVKKERDSGTLRQHAYKLKKHRDSTTSYNIMLCCRSVALTRCSFNLRAVLSQCLKNIDAVLSQCCADALFF